MKSVWLIAGSVLIEAVRRKEIYAIIVIALILIAGVMSIDFFQMTGLFKFYFEVALKIMSISTALLVIVMSASQLSREFENRTIYTLLAKPVSRLTFMAGKLLGILMAAAFCFGLFMLIFVIGTYYLGAKIYWTHFLEYVYLQLIMMAVLANLGFLLSLLMNLDAAITLGVVFFITSNIYTTGISYIYDYVNKVGQAILLFLNYAIPQITLFDFSEKTVHADVWDPLSLKVMIYLSLYALFFIALYFTLSFIVFRRKAL